MEYMSLQSLLERIREDLKTLDKAYGLLSTDQEAMLLRDIEYLFLDNVARDIRFVFLDSERKDSVVFQQVYMPGAKPRCADMMGLLQAERDKELVFDVYVSFTEGFLRLDPEEQKLVLGNTERDWYTYI